MALDICASLTLAQSPSSLVALNAVFKQFKKKRKQNEHFQDETGTMEIMRGTVVGRTVADGEKKKRLTVDGKHRAVCIRTRPAPSTFPV